MNYIDYWKEKTGFAESFFLDTINVTRGRLLDWRNRSGDPNLHNGKIPKENQLEDWEKKAIVDYYISHPFNGYRRITYMMIDENIIATSPPTVYRVLKSSGVMRKWDNKKSTSQKGKGFNQPKRPHQHWHTDVSYLNICGTFYYLCAVLDGYSRYIIHWEIREKMETKDIEIIQQRAIEAFPGNKTRLISDNGPQFISREFKEFIRNVGLTHVRTSPFYPQSNGKIERFHGTYKKECIRPLTPLSLDDGIRITGKYIDYYNNERLHAAIGYLTPKTKLEGTENEVIKVRNERLRLAAERRKSKKRECHA